MCIRCGACVQSCPNDALRIGKIIHNGKEYERIEFSPNLCDSCGKCIETCPYDMLKLTGKSEKPLEGFCVMCLKCIEACDKAKKSALSLK